MRRARFSLITLIVAVNVAGVLVWANVRRIEVSKSIEHQGMTTAEGALKEGHYRGWGWPFQYLEMLGADNVEFVLTVEELEEGVETPIEPERSVRMVILLNTVTCLLVLVALMILTEFLVRKFRRPADPPAGQPQKPVDA